MEQELVGAFLHRLAQRAAGGRRHPEAAVSLDDTQRPLRVFFRGLGGGHAQLRVEGAEAASGRARWVDRLAGRRPEADLAWTEPDSLRLPPVIDHFPEARLNRALYFWLAAYLACEESLPGFPADLPEGLPAPLRHLLHGAAVSAAVRQRLPALGPRYAELGGAHLRQRGRPTGPALHRLHEAGVARALGAQSPADEADFPEAVAVWLDHALAAAESGEGVPAPPEWVRRLRPVPVQPVPLWGHPDPPTPVAARGGADPDREGSAPEQGEDRSGRKRRGRKEDGSGRTGIPMPRFEWLPIRSETVPVDMPDDGDPDSEYQKALDDMPEPTLSETDAPASARFRIDLDLAPAAAEGGAVEGPWCYPEWDAARGAYRADWCRVSEDTPEEAAGDGTAIPPELRRLMRRTRRRFEAWCQRPRWEPGALEGAELDLDAWTRAWTERRAGGSPSPRVFFRQVRQDRDLAVAVLADLSRSTEAWVGDRPVIAVIRESLLVLEEALRGAGDDAGLFGFTSRRRGDVRFLNIKGFDEPFGAPVQRRILGLQPQYYTRMGAAVRHAAAQLARRPARSRLLLVLSDGKPHDADGYEGGQAAADTRRALGEARRRGIRPFGVTVDRRGRDYLPQVFGPGGYAVVRHVGALPKILPRVYAELRSG